MLNKNSFPALQQLKVLAKQSLSEGSFYTLDVSWGSTICVLWYFFKHDVPSLKLMGIDKVT